MNARIVDVILGARDRAPWAYLGAGLAVAVAIHGSVVWAATSSRPGLGAWGADVLAKVREELRNQAPIAVEKVPAPKPPERKPDTPKPPEPKVADVSVPKVETPSVAERTPPAKPKATRRGNPLALAPSPAGPVDFGGTFPAGNGTPDGDPNGPIGPPGDVKHAEPALPSHPAEARVETPKPGPDRSKRLALADPTWTCPWPAAADDAQIDRQSAVVRVVVNAAGRAEAASVVKDPGFGFGPAAVRCALTARYVASRDREGRSVKAESAVRVDFSR